MTELNYVGNSVLRLHKVIADTLCNEMMKDKLR